MRQEPFKVQDYYDMVKNPMSGFCRWVDGGLSEVLAYHAATGLVRTLRDDERIYAIAGVNHVFSGVCEVFFIPALGWHSKKKSVVRCLRDNCQYLAGAYRRVQATCQVRDEYLRFVEFLGFRVEGVLTEFDRFNDDYFILRYRGKS